jgi:hypothetical protein
MTIRFAMVRGIVEHIPRDWLHVRVYPASPRALTKRRLLFGSLRMQGLNCTHSCSV